MAMTQMMQHYLTLKEKYGDCLVFFRLGDFYEMFFEDAQIASKELELTLTGRNCGMEERAPMCGVPHHAVDSYVTKLIQRGYKVAICEQLTEPKPGELVERDVVRVITPGTAIEDDILDAGKNNYVACVCGDGKQFAIAWADVSTGEFNTMQSGYSDFSALEDAILAVMPAEILCDARLSEDAKRVPEFRLERYPKFQLYYDWAFDYATAYKLLLKQFGVLNLEKFEFEDKKLSVAACGALINYLLETQKRAMSHIRGIRYVTSGNYLILDAAARRNLEIFSNVKDGGKRASLLWAIDKTQTSMGARMLRRWLEQPLRDAARIGRRQDGAAELSKKAKIRGGLRETLSRVRDMERLTSKIAYGNPHPRDLISLRDSLEQLPEIKRILGLCESDILSECDRSIEEMADIRELLRDAIVDQPPLTLSEGGYIKTEFNEELAALRNAKQNAQEWLRDLEAKEREETGIRNLKIGYNKVFGYFIEVTKMNVDKVPFRYQRKQTLVNCERYITEDLKKIEDNVTGAHEKALQLESRLYEELKLTLVKAIPLLQSAARGIAVADVVASFAESAVKNNYCRPEIVPETEGISIVGGRHPVVELLLKSGEFVPNDTVLDCYQNRTMIITGPNMSGKSTYMRQVALIVLMAHIGSFVPAKGAKIAVTDRIFTRIGASDDLAFGRSTFMMEMVEVATILQNATFRSLLVLDEIGRGTSTFDGMSIARAVMENITTKIRCKTLFSTHYHELTELEEQLEGVKNYKIVASERAGGVVFLHKITRGGTNKSFGIEVAKLAGVSDEVIARSKEISRLLEKNPITSGITGAAPLLEAACDNAQEDWAAKLRALDVETLTPVEALTTLYEWKKAAEENL